MKLFLKWLRKYLAGYEQQKYMHRISYCRNKKNLLYPEREICPVCGYYCLGKGGEGCIDKPTLCGFNIRAD